MFSCSNVRTSEEVRSGGHLEASDAVVSLELPAVLVPLQGRGGVAAGLAAELDGLTGWNGVKLFGHLLWVSPLRRHR